MDIGDFFRSIFGLRRNPNFGPPLNERPPGNLPDIDCQDDEDDLQENEFAFFFGDDHGNLDDMFQHFHGDMFRQMESLHRQMDDMMKGFGAIMSDHANPFDNPRVTDKPNSDNGNEIFSWSFGLPQKENIKSKNPRDFMLKDKEDTSPPPDSMTPSPSRPKTRNSESFDFKWNFHFPSFNESSPEKKADTDLDGKVNQKEVLDLIKKSEHPEPKGHVPDHSGFFSSQSSVSWSTVRGPDGRVEQKKVVRDSSGREQTTVTRSIGDQTHSVTTILDEQGQKEHHEDFKNMDENDTKKFDEKWNSHGSSSPGVPSFPMHSNDRNLFSRLFGGSW